MTKKAETIKTWHWRIERVGHTAQSFAAMVGILNSSLSHYKSGAQEPREDKFRRIEQKLIELEKEKGFV